MFPSLGRLAALSLVVAGATASGCATTEEADPSMTMNPPPGNAADKKSCPSLGLVQEPAVHPQLEPPSGSTLMMRYRAEGKQIYTCKVAAEGAAPAWALKAPEANLYDESCKLVGTHFGGPTWKVTADGSAVMGMKIAETPALEAGAIPWLLIKTTSTGAAGVMSSVGYIQRVDTVGGVAPTGGCEGGNIGTERAVPYTAVYYFYAAAAVSPSPAPGPGYGG
jgi:hypothetical protein